MKKHIAITLGLALLTPGGTAMAEGTDHYEGRKPESLEEAVALLSEYNAKLGKILEQDSLTGAQMEKIHQLSYTLENSLNRINSDLYKLTRTLEEVHLASERRDAGTVKDEGRAYLSTAGTVVE